MRMRKFPLLLTPLCSILAAITNVLTMVLTNVLAFVTTIVNTIVLQTEDVVPKMKNACLQLRMTPSDLAEVKAAAERADLTVSAWVTEHLLSAARTSGVPALDVTRYVGPELLTSAPITPSTKPRERSRAAEPAIDPADAELVFEALGRGCLLCGEPGHVVAADHEKFTEGVTGPSNLQVLCDDCTDGGQDFRDHTHLDAIKKADRQSDSS